jgi:hypothetical protein
MKIVILDQNKWIELARAESGKCKSKSLIDLYGKLINKVHRGDVIIPLTLSNIIETSKRNDISSRKHLSRIQSELSRGWVIRSRKGRLSVEIQAALRKIFNDPPSMLPDGWALAPGFMQAFEEFDELVAPIHEANKTRFLNRNIDPIIQIYDFLVNQNDENRRKGILAFSCGSDDLITEIENRRHRFKDYSKIMQERAYGAILFYDHQNIIFNSVLKIGRTIEEFKSLGEYAFVKLIDYVPTFDVERSLAVVIEKLNRGITRNDCLDMHLMCGGIVYSHCIVGERMFIHLAKQCKLDRKYNLHALTNLLDLIDILVL